MLLAFCLFFIHEPHTSHRKHDTMNEFSVIGTFCGICGGLGVFLLGMKHISDGLQAVAGSRMRKLVAASTSNRFAGVATGTVVTGIIQSSSITTVMVVGLVSASLMTLPQAVNVIIGANIGTTATAWVVSIFPSLGSSFGLGLSGVAALVYLFAFREKWRYIGLAFLGLGLIFYGLDTMNSFLKPLSQSQTFIDVLQLFQADSVWGFIKCIGVGIVATAIIQSSSALTAISITLAINGMMSFDTAASMVLGMNVGTTVTAWLASCGATTEARRAALAHTLFNLIGVCIMAPLFLPVILPWFRWMWDIPEFVPGVANVSIGQPISMVHTFFNVANTCIFLPFVGPFVKLICWVLPSKAKPEASRLTILNPLKLAPVVAVEQARKETEIMAAQCAEMMAEFRKVLTGESTNDSEQALFKSENHLDLLQHDITSFLGVVIERSLSTDVARRARMLLRVADEYESVSDEVVSLMKMIIRQRRNDKPFSKQGLESFLALHDLCEQFGKSVTLAFYQGKNDAQTVLENMSSDAQLISKRIKELRAMQMARLTDHNHPDVCPANVVVALDMLNIYRRLKEDFLNVGDAMLDESRTDTI